MPTTLTPPVPLSVLGMINQPSWLFVAMDNFRFAFGSQLTRVCQLGAIGLLRTLIVELPTSTIPPIWLRMERSGSVLRRLHSLRKTADSKFRPWHMLLAIWRSDWMYNTQAPSQAVQPGLARHMLPDSILSCSERAFVANLAQCRESYRNETTAAELMGLFPETLETS